MSGGSWDYVYCKFDDVATQLQSEKSPLRRALGDHLDLIAKAMKAIEWEDSGDTAKGSSREEIQAVFEDLAAEKEISVLLKDGREIIKALEDLGA
jgi:hypothetical protein